MRCWTFLRLTDMSTRHFDRWMATKMNLEEGDFCRKKINDYVADKIKETLEYVIANSEFYRGKIGDTVPEDFRKIPFTDSDELTLRPEQMLCVPARDIARIVTLNSGGTEGKSKRIYFSEEDIELTVDFFANGMQNIIDETDSLLILMPHERPHSIGELLKTGVERMGAKAVAFGLLTDDDSYAKVAGIIEGEGITSITAMPTQAQELASRFPALAIQSVLLSGEYVASEAVDTIRDSWPNCRVFEHYGMTETGLGGAVGCSRGEGYHIREADLFFEIIDPATGEVKPDGEWGEAVFTTLTRNAMPLVRYRTGDITRIIAEPCSCGSPVKRLDRVGDRKYKKGWIRETARGEE